MPIQVFDFFSGCGGTSRGFADAGMDIAFALDNDKDAIKTFSFNFPNTVHWNSDIRTVSPSDIPSHLFTVNDPVLFCGCAPCQPFSRQNRNKFDKDPRKDLLSEFGRFVSSFLPDYIVLENVPGLQKVDTRDGQFALFMELLDSLNYHCSWGILPALWFGVPQKRERLVLLAARHADIQLPQPSNGPGRANENFSTVREWIWDLPPIAAGEKHPNDPDHEAANLSEINSRRIAATPEGGGRQDWPEELWLDCHKQHNGHTDVYGRLSWDKPASGLTTRCISLSNGRFGHPEQNRAISLREAACLQTFPKNYRFSGSLRSKARQVGNAVAPLMAQRIGEHINAHAGINPM
jgi:DNA (cytosine-5)-methyltransferase 1